MLNKNKHQKIKVIRQFYLLVFIFVNTLSYSFNKKIVERVKSPSTFSIQKDSTLYNDYKKIKFLLENKKYDVALKNGLVLLEKSKKKENNEIRFLSAVLIGDIFKETNNVKKALGYYKLSLSLIKDNLISQKDRNEINNFEKAQKSDLAKSLLLVASSHQIIGHKDSARFYYNELLEIESLDKKIRTIKARAYANLSGIYYIDSLYEKAKEYANRAIAINTELNNKLFLSESLSNLANIYFEEGKLDKAKEYYFEAIKLIEKNKDLKAIRNKELYYDNLAWTLYNQKNYIAYNYLDKSFKIRDSLREVEVRDILAEIEGKYNVNEARKEEELKRAKAQRTSWIIGIASLLVIISLLYFLNFYKLKQKNLGLELSQKELIQKQSIEKIKSESQIKILNATLDGKESERKQIAETLHDSVSTLLSSATLHLQATRKQFNGSTPIEIDKTQQIITEASQKIRDLSHTLVSSVLLKFGLNFALKDMADKYSNSEITIHTNLKNLRRYQQGFEIKAHNIIQEFVNNVLKHSKAKNATVSLEEKENKLFLRIEDDGKGFNINDVTNKDGLGINQIDARIQMMKGKFEIESEPNKGTTIIVELPIVEKEPANYA